MNCTILILRRFLPVFFLLICPVCVSAALNSPANMSNIPIPFIEHQGQHLKFSARTHNGSATVSSDEGIVYTLAGKGGRLCTINEIPVRGLQTDGIEGQGLLKARATVFHGKDPRKTLRMFASVNMGDIVEGIGLTLHAYNSNVEKVYTVQPGADPTSIRMKIEGGTLSINGNGQLEVLTTQGSISFTAPVAYQEDITGKKEPVQVSYSLQGNEYGFRVGPYDTSRNLVIDPLLASTYLGGSFGSGIEVAYDIALDAAGNVYVAGETPSSDFPVTDGSSLSGDGTTDGFIAKFNADLSELLAATFIGGSMYDTLESIVVYNGKVYAAGRTNSNDCPTTAGTYNNVFAGQSDIYLCILDDSLETLDAATYLGGTDSDQTPDLALSPDGDLFVVLETSSLDFPMTSPDGKTPYQDELRHSKNFYSDVAIARLSGDLTALEASTYLGGSGSTYGYGYEDNPQIALDEASGDVWVAGSTGATDFPTTEGAYRRSVLFDGDDYVFLSRLDEDLTDLEASTYLGHSHSSFTVALALADDGNVYVAGRTYADEPWPVTDGAYDSTVGDTFNKGFICRVKEDDLSELEASTLLGGSQAISNFTSSPISDMTIDSSGNVVVVGVTESSDFPTTEDAYDRTPDSYYVSSSSRSYPYFIAKLDADLSNLSAGTYLGNKVYGDTAYPAVALDDSDNVYLCGMTASPYFPTTEDAYDTSYNSGQYGWDAFVSKLDSTLSRNIYVNLALSTDIESLSVTAGGETSFTLTVGNQGPDASGSVILTCTLPDDLTFVSATPGQGTAVHESDVITCEMGTIEASGEVSVSIVVQAPATSGDLSATASVSSAQTDTNEADNSLSISISVTEEVLPVVVDDDDDSICFITAARR